jgi:tRNA G18 (ribose-2'-O)-methylase SpoU
MVLPRDCKVVAIELLDEAVDLPSFAHPQRACYVLGRERGAVSKDLIARADHVIRIPTKFCINVGLAGAIVMYDRVLSLRRFPPRPLMVGQDPDPLPEPFFGDHTPRGRKD